MKLFNKSFVLAACLTFLAGCASHTDLESLKDYNQDFKEENINVFLKSFSDHRQGKTLLKAEGDEVLYAYDPQNVTSGQMLPLLGYYLYKAVDFQDDAAANSVGIDVSIRNVDTSIRNSHFPVTRLGYYTVEVQARVIIRDMVSKEIIDIFPVVVSATKLRKTTTGRAPSAQEDKYSMLELFEEVSLELADEVLDEVEDLLDDYYIFDDMEKMIAKTTKVTEEPKYVEKAHEIKMPEVKTEDLNATVEMIEHIEAEEQKLLDRKKAQRELFEKKLEDQKYLDFLDKQQ